jgi:hypothetical protein
MARALDKPLLHASQERERRRARDRRGRGGGGRRSEDGEKARKPPFPTHLLAHLMGQILTRLEPAPTPPADYSKPLDRSHLAKGVFRNEVV